MLLYSSNAGDLVFDPFLGSGTVAIVSQREGRHFLGFEIVPEYFTFANECLWSEGEKHAEERNIKMRR